MANIILEHGRPLRNGEILTFPAPCNCDAVTGIRVNYVGDNGTSSYKVFTFTDAHGNALTGIGNLFVTGVLIAAVFDTTHNKAYLLNADTNKYIEQGFRPSTWMPTAEQIGAATQDHTHTAEEFGTPVAHTHSASDIQSGTLAAARLPTVPVNNGGTGATDGATGLKNLLAAGPTILSAHQYGDTLPATGVEGQIFFLRVQEDE